MFDSGYPVEKLVLEVESETNLAFPVTRESYVSWYNLCEQGLYSDVIKEEKTECADYKAGLCLSDIPASDGYYDFMRSDDKIYFWTSAERSTKWSTYRLKTIYAVLVRIMLMPRRATGLFSESRTEHQTASYTFYGLSGLFPSVLSVRRSRERSCCRRNT